MRVVIFISCLLTYNLFCINIVFFVINEHKIKMTTLLVKNSLVGFLYLLRNINLLVFTPCHWILCLKRYRCSRTFGIEFGKNSSAFKFMKFWIFRKMGGFALRMNLGYYQNRRKLKKMQGIDLYVILKPTAKFKLNWFTSFKITPLLIFGCLTCIRMGIP